MYMLDDKPLDPNAPFEHDGVLYPPGWLQTASPEEKEAIGVTEVPDPPPVNDRFYLSDGVPKPIEWVQAMFTSEIKARAQQEILHKYPAWHQSNVNSRGVELVHTSASDRELTPGENAEIVGFKVMWDDIKALRAHSDALEAEMLALSFEELTAWQQHGWPESTP